MTDTEFHKSHEDLTEKIYNNSGMLPSRYVYVITNRCNLNCNFCFQDKKPKENNLTGENWINLTKQLPDYARVTLTGGEPFMFPEFNKVFSYTAERFNCNIITNGILLNEKKIDYLLSYPKFKVMSISIDDIGNKIRSVTKEQWNHLEKMLDYFVKKRDETGSKTILDIKTMILDDNAENLFEIYRYVRENIKADSHAFQFLKGSPIQHADYMFSFEGTLKKSEAYIYKKFDEIKEQLDKVKDYNIKNSKASFLHPKFFSLDSEESSCIDIINEESHIKEKYESCKFPWSSVHINPDGNLFPCLAVSMGNVKKKSLSEIINGKDFEKFKNMIKENGTIEACNRCGWLRLRK